MSRTSMRLLAAGDELLVNDYRVKIAGRSKALPRWPPRPLLYTTFSNAVRILLPERRRLTFVLATAKPGVPPRELASRIQAQTGLRARASDDFKADTARWFLINSEDVGDIAAMLSLAMSVGLGVTGTMLYMFYPREFEAVRGSQGDGRDLETAVDHGFRADRTLEPAIVFAGR